MAMHKIPGYEIFVGSLFALRGQKSLSDAGITHVLSAVRGQLDEKLVGNFKHLHLQVDDDDEEDLIRYFPKTNAFINDALESGGAVLVHCIAGISRSVTITTAYIMSDRQITVGEALAIVCEGRAVANPNESFLEQLEVYAKDNYTVNENSVEYRRWKLRKESEIAAAAGTAPLPTIYSDVKAGLDSTVELRCKKCRCPVAQSSAIVPHTPQTRADTKIGPRTVSILSAQCMHYFTDPVRWMQPELEKGLLEGKFDCPKCKTKIGSYRWQGMKCSCGKWITPGISIQRGRVDETRILTSRA
ncbi:dual specificity phosphatase [Lipomyces arxii]|uniref:dual specificity phosphatase n=1 Tax=Lipomyces arxii TaxID=56418 RepID=UPI0034CEB1F9